MASQFIQDGELLDYTAGGSAVAAAQIIAGTDRAFVAPRAIAANSLGSIATSGVFQLPKATGTAWTLGQKLYYDSSEDEVVTDSGANKVIGYAAAGAASGAAEGLVLLGT